MKESWTLASAPRIVHEVCIKQSLNKKVEIFLKKRTSITTSWSCSFFIVLLLVPKSWLPSDLISTLGTEDISIPPATSPQPSYCGWKCRLECLQAEKGLGFRSAASWVSIHFTWTLYKRWSQPLLHTKVHCFELSSVSVY